MRSIQARLWSMVFLVMVGSFGCVSDPTGSTSDYIIRSGPCASGDLNTVNPCLAPAGCTNNDQFCDPATGVWTQCTVYDRCFMDGGVMSMPIDGAVPPDGGGCTDGARQPCTTSDNRFGQRVCFGGVYGTCGPLGPACASTAETCNNLDDDCDGTADDGLGSTTCGVGACLRTVTNCVAGVPQTCTPGTPGTETCNSIDDDCDGVVDDGLGTTTCGVGVCQRNVNNCVGGMVQTCTPGAAGTETCNGLDDDCDGMTDEMFGSTTCGVGACVRTTNNCVGGVVTTCTPGAPGTEVCNNMDDDCDGMTDEALGSTTCGVGTCVRTTNNCVGGVAQTCTPGAAGTETCNGLDDDCDSMVDEALGSTMCGVGACIRTVNNCVAGAPQTCVAGAPGTETCNNIDDDCDGVTDDNLGTSTCGVGACIRTVPNCMGGMVQTCTPGTAGVETCNGIDDDCDGMADEGLAIPQTCGVGACARTIASQCVAGVPQMCVAGSATAETCNGIDDDCDGMADEGLAVPVSCGVGACARTVTACVAGVPQTCTPGAAATETCNNIDDDCDGAIDEALGSTTCGVGACARTVNNCVAGAPQTCVAGAPGTETCNGIDDDCDGTADDGLAVPVNCGVGVCTRTVTACVAGVPQMCIPGAAGTETCNGLDDDCDGMTDEGVCVDAGVDSGTDTGVDAGTDSGPDASADADASVSDAGPLTITITLSAATQAMCSGGYTTVLYDNLGTERRSAPGAAITWPYTTAWGNHVVFTALCNGSYAEEFNWTPFVGMTAQAAGVASIQVTGRAPTEVANITRVCAASAVTSSRIRPVIPVYPAADGTCP